MEMDLKSNTQTERRSECVTREFCMGRTEQINSSIDNLSGNVSQLSHKVDKIFHILEGNGKPGLKSDVALQGAKLEALSVSVSKHHAAAATAEPKLIETIAYLRQGVQTLTDAVNRINTEKDGTHNFVKGVVLTTILCGVVFGIFAFIKVNL